MRRYYQILGVSPNATPEEIKAAWLFSIKAFHPDKFSTSSPQQKRTADERTKAINEAYGVLSNPHKRLAYDKEFAHKGRDAAAPPKNTNEPPPPPPPPPPPAPASTPAPASGMMRGDSTRGLNTGGLVIVGVLLVGVTTALILTNFHKAAPQTVLSPAPTVTPSTTTKKAVEVDTFLDEPKTLPESEKVERDPNAFLQERSDFAATSPSPTPRVTYRVSGLPKRTPFLNIRVGPGANYAVIAIFTPAGRGIILGPGRVRNGETMWQEIFSGSYHGWVNAEYLMAETPKP